MIVLIVAGLILLGVICTYFLVKFFRAGTRGEYVRGDRVMCHRTAQSHQPEEGIVELVMTQHFTLCGNAPSYSVVFQDDGQRHRVPAVQMIKKLGRADHDVEHFPDEGSLAFLTSYEARSLVDEIIDESTSAESRDHHVEVPSDNSGAEESGGSLVESVLRTVNEIIDKDNWPQNEAAPANMNQVESNEGEAEGAYDDRDEGYADPEPGYEELVQQTVRQVLQDRNTDNTDDTDEQEQEDVMNVNATQLVESVLRTMDDDNVENDMSIDQPTTSIAAQNLVEDLMDDVWTEEVTTEGSPESGNASDRSKQFVSGILNEIALEDTDSSSSGDASDQSKEFVSDVLNGLSDDKNKEIVASASQDFVSSILDEVNMESSSDAERATVDV